jgi:hypothetical protein
MQGEPEADTAPCIWPAFNGYSVPGQVAQTLEEPQNTFAAGRLPGFISSPAGESTVNKG